MDLESGRRRVLRPPAGRLHGDRPVAEDPAAGTQPSGDATGEPTMGLVPEVVQVEFVHETLDGEVDLPTLLAAGDAVAHPDDVDALEAQAMVETEQLAGVPRQAGEILNHDGVELRRGRTGRGHELLIARALLDAEAGEGGIVVGRDDHPALPLGVGPTQLNLVVDGGGGLQVSGIPGVDRTALHLMPPRSANSCMASAASSSARNTSQSATSGRDCRSGGSKRSMAGRDGGRPSPRAGLRWTGGRRSGFTVLVDSGLIQRRGQVSANGGAATPKPTGHLPD